jgi:hypothetical protein
VIPKGYIRATRNRPCPICGKPDWCLVAKDGSSALCPRVRSLEDRGEAGYFHRIGDAVAREPVKFVERAGRMDIRWDDICARMEDEAETVGAFAAMSIRLGVSPESLRRLNMGFAEPLSAFSFPMRDATDRIIGVRLRDANGNKTAIRGSRNGLFIPRGPSNAKLPLLVVEGPTDAAAALDLGFEVVGRPSCSACVDMTCAYCRGRDVVVVEDHDEPKVLPGGKVFYPGQEGAAKLAAVLRATARTIKVIAPIRAKDLRAWVRAGATRDLVKDVIANTGYWRKAS